MILPSHVRVGPSPIHGQGLFATDQPIPAGEAIEYSGKKISVDEVEVNGNRYLFNFDDKWVVDGAAESNLARWINHSCAPNCFANNTEDKLMIETARDIAAGEELTLNYGPGYFDQFIRETGCRCTACLNPKPDVTVNEAGLVVTMPSGLILGVKWSHEQKQELQEWFKTQDLAPGL